MPKDESILSKLPIKREKAEIILPMAIFGIAWLLLFFSPLKYMWNMSNQLSRTLSALSFLNNSFLDPMLSFELPEGFPLYPFIDYLAISTLENVEAGRLISFLFGLGTLFLVHKIAILWFDRKTAKYSSLLLAISPLFILDSMAIKRETMVLFFSSLSFLFLSKYKIEKKQIFLILTGISLTLAVLAKPVGIFIFVGVGIYLLYEQKLKLFREPGFYIGIAFPALLGLIMFVFPYLAQGGLHYGGNNVTWHLINYLDVSLSNVIKDVTLELTVLLPLPLLILAIGGIKKLKDLSSMAVFWLSSGALFYIIFLSGAYHHTHYASMMLPPLAIIGAKGVKPTGKKISKFIVKNKISMSKLVIPLGLLIALSSISYCYADFVEPNYRYQDEMENVGRFMQNELKYTQSIGLTQNAQPIFFHLFPENRENVEFLKDKKIVRFKKKPLEELENLENKPEIIILQTKPCKYPSLYTPQGEESKWGETPRIPKEDLKKMLENHPYKKLKEFEYFTIIKKDSFSYSKPKTGTP